MRKLLLCLLGCVFMTACVQNAPASMEIIINNCPVAVDLLSDRQNINLPLLTTERANTIDFSGVQGISVWMDDKWINPTKPHEFLVPTIGQEHVITLRVQIKGIQRTLYLNTVPDDFASMVALNNGAQPGVYYMGVGNYAVKMDEKGNLLFYKHYEGTVWDFNRIEIKTDQSKKVRYTVLHTADNKRPLGSVSYSVSNAEVLDESYARVDKIEGLAPFDQTQTPLESHDFHYFDDGHYLLSAYVGKRVTSVNAPYGARVVACVLQEVKDGKVLWQFDSTENQQLFGRSAEGNDYENKAMPWADYAHFNAFAIDPKDGNVLVSLRNVNCVLKLERGTGRVLWQLGGKGDQFGLSAKQQFSRAHAVQVLENGAILLFDNGNTSNVLAYPPNSGEEPLPQTRIIEMILDEQNKKITAFSEHSLLGYFSYAAGNAHKQSPAHYVVGWGGRSTGMPLISEVDFLNKRILFEVMTGLDTVVYRAYKYQQ